MVGCLDDCSDPNSEQFGCSDDCFEIRTRTIPVRTYTWTYKNISQKSSKPKRASFEQGASIQPQIFLTCPHNIPRTLKLRQILNLPVPIDDMPCSSTTVWALNDVAGQQELGPKGPSAILPLSPIRCFYNLNRTFRLLIFLKLIYKPLVQPGGTIGTSLF